MLWFLTLSRSHAHRFERPFIPWQGEVLCVHLQKASLNWQGDAGGVVSTLASLVLQVRKTMEQLHIQKLLDECIAY